MPASLSNGTLTVSLDINWDMMRNEELIVDRVRTIGGRAADKVWASFKKFRFSMSNIPSSDAGLINEWWEGTDVLDFEFDNYISSIYISNQGQPFQGLPKPYYNEWNGNLILDVIRGGDTYEILSNVGDGILSDLGEIIKGG